MHYQPGCYFWTGGKLRFNSQLQSTMECTGDTNCICVTTETYESVSPSPTQNRVCSKWSPACSGSTYMSTAPTSTTDRVCTNCRYRADQSCSGQGQYQSTPCDGSQLCKSVFFLNSSYCCSRYQVLSYVFPLLHLGTLTSVGATPFVYFPLDLS
jgi:hypothetical protein